MALISPATKQFIHVFNLTLKKIWPWYFSKILFNWKYFLKHWPGALAPPIPVFEVKWSEVAQSYLTLCNAMDCSLPCSSVHGIFQARVQKWVAISFSRVSSQPRDQTWVSRIVGRRFTIWATREACRVHHAKCHTGWSTSWNQDCWEKYQLVTSDMQMTPP